MTITSNLRIEKFTSICEKILKNHNVRYICLINKMGKLLVEQKQKKVDFLLPNKKAKDLYIKLKLESLLIKDFDDDLGKLTYVIIRREKVQMIIIPVYGYVIMISVTKNSNPNLIANSTLELFEKIVESS